MSFDDQAHVARIADALWSHSPTGTAAVLVGAGFSKNATKSLASARPMAGWNEIYMAMVDALYRADDPAVQTQRAALMGQAGATSSYLRVAEEFESEFRREALDKLIRAQVPDLEYAPGDLHRQLLELPWADVLTTNWDSLLERTAAEVEDRVYHVVRTIEEIPETHTPRIIKLHGSLPAHRPFVFTEEDFRTYPDRAAPFLNLAQQITMQNTLVLVGFSGDDPNFLFWSGWVRDRLGDHAPLIYLVGALDLSPSKRKMLERRLIQPIDLAKLPGFTGWHPDERHQNATRWFLEELRAAQPYRGRKWPRPQTELYPRLTLVTRRPSMNAPSEMPRGRTTGQETSVEILETLVPVWRQHRLTYPGWIIAPPDARQLVWQQMQSDLHSSIQGISELPVEDRVSPLFELNWRYEVALVPLVIDLGDIVAQTIDAVAPRYASLGSVQQAQIRSLGLALVRHAREENEDTLFARWSSWLEPHVAHHPEEQERLTYERCLQHAGRLDINALEAALDQWNVGGEPFWLVRKARLLSDIGRDSQAETLVVSALADIRARTDKTIDDLPSWSRESMVMLLRSAFLNRMQAWLDNQPERDRFAQRNDAIASRGYDGRADFFSLVEELSHTPPPIVPDVERKQRFDIGTENTTQHLSKPHPVMTRLLALQALRFLEEAGLPARAGNVGLASQLLRRAALWLVDVLPERAYDLFLRDKNPSGDLVDILFSRRNVSRLAVAHAERLFDRLLSLADAARARIGSDASTTDDWHDELKLSCELVSRLVLRLPARTVATLQLATSLYQTPGMLVEQRLGREIVHLFERSFEVMDPRDADLELAALYRLLPLDDVSNPYTTTDAISELDPGEGNAGSGEAWSETTAILIEASKSRDTRPAAIRRLIRMSISGRVASDDREKLAEALWSDTDLQGLPKQETFYPSVFVALPAPPAIDPLDRLKRAFLPQAAMSNEQASSMVLLTLLQEEAFPLDRMERFNLATRFKGWLEGPLPKSQGTPFGDTAGEMRRTSTRLFAQIARRIQPDEPASAVLGEILTLDQDFVTTDAALPALVRLGLVPASVAAGRIEAMIRSDVSDRRSDLPQIFYSLSKEDPPFEDFAEQLWNAAALAVVSRRPGQLLHLLSMFAFAYRDRADSVPKIVDHALETALWLIEEETRPDVDLAVAYDGFAARFFAARLIGAMARAGRANQDLITVWVDAGVSDGLPDVRKALDRFKPPS